MSRCPNEWTRWPLRACFSGLAFLLGAAVGSFLNVCIYRLPRDLSVNEPRRSFCPAAKIRSVAPQFSARQLALAGVGSAPVAGAHRLSLLRGRAPDGASLPLPSGLVFPWPIALVYWVFVSLLVAATFIDFEHFIIPDEITIGGTVAGVLASLAVPALMGEVSRVGRRAFVRLSRPGLWFALARARRRQTRLREKEDPARGPDCLSAGSAQGDDAEFVVGEEREMWSEHFARESDRMLLRLRPGRNRRTAFSAKSMLQFHYDRVAIAEEEFQLDQVDRIYGHGARVADSAGSNGPG